MSPSKDRMLQAKSKNDRSEQQSPKLSVTIIPTLEIHELAQVLRLPLQKLPTNTSLWIISNSKLSCSALAARNIESYST